jgi:hypothetical protein
MKKIFITILAILIYTSTLKAQSNLEFNRAVKEKISVNFTGLNTTIIVPNGKILKICSASVYPSTYTTVTGWSVPTIDGQSINALPIWLPAGTYSVVWYVTSANGVFFSYSGIEFNIVP